MYHNDEPEPEYQSRCQVISDGTIVIGDVRVSPRDFDDPDLYRKIRPGFDYYDAMRELLILIRKKEVPAALENNTIIELKANNSELQKNNAALRSEVDNQKKQIEALNKKIEELTSTVKNKESFIELLQVLKNCKHLEKPLDDILKGVVEINNDLADWLDDTDRQIKESVGSINDNIIGLRSFTETKNNESAMILECLKKEITQSLDSNHSATLTEVARLINESVGKQSEKMEAMQKELVSAIQNSNTGRFQAVENRLAELKTDINNLSEDMNSRLNEMNEATKEADEDTKAAAEDIKESASENKQSKPLKHESLMLKALETPKSVPELVAMGIPQRSAYNEVKILQTRGLVKQVERGKYVKA